MLRVLLSLVFSFFCVIFFWPLPTFAQHAENTKAFLRSVPNIDLKYLNRFFYAYFLEDDFSYTLFGDKPMSFSGISNQKTSYEQILPKICYSKPSIGQAFEVFKKWRSKFLNKNYLFVFNEDVDGVFIYFINKQSFIKVINENIDIFLKELGDDFTVDIFLKKVVGEQKSLLDIIHHHEGILGILLGYGRHNSMLFQRKADILGRCWAYTDRITQNEWIPENSFDFNSAQEELEYLDNKLGCFSEEHEYRSLVPVSPLGFAADNYHSETKKLKEKYQAVQQKINKAYTRNTPFEVILDILMDDNVSYVESQ